MLIYFYVQNFFVNININVKLITRNYIIITNVWIFLIGTPKFESRALGTRGKLENLI